MENRDKDKIVRSKSLHIFIQLSENENFKKKSTSFEYYDFDHNCVHIYKNSKEKFKLIC